MPEPRVPGLRPCPHGAIGDAELAALGLTIDKVIDFSVSSNPLGPSPAAMRSLQAVDASRYPDSGCAGLRQRLAAELGVDTANLVCGNGSAELIWLTLLAFARPGDSALVVGPTFGEYERAARIFGCQVQHLNAAEEDGFRLRIRDLVDAVERLQPRFVFLCNPNNPTGLYLIAEEIRAVAQSVPRGLLILDEAYRAFTPCPWPSEDLIASGSVLLLRSMTKDFALAGLRLGYAVARPDVVSAIDAVRPPWNVGAPAQVAGLATLEDPEHRQAGVEAVVRGKEALLAGLRRLGLAYYDSSANFLLVRVGDAGGFRRKLLKLGCVVRDCSSFGLPAYIRIGIRTVSECRRLLEAMEVVLRV